MEQILLARSCPCYRCIWELVKYGITELRNNEICKTYILQIVQIVICSIVIILYLPCNSSAWRTTAMDRTAAGEHQMGRAHNQSSSHDLPSLTLPTYTPDSNLKSFEIHLKTHNHWTFLRDSNKFCLMQMKGN